VFRLLFKLSLRDLVRMFLMRGYEFTHETYGTGKNALPR
jgi:transposase-like protein